MFRMLPETSCSNFGIRHFCVSRSQLYHCLRLSATHTMYCCCMFESYVAGATDFSARLSWFAMSLSTWPSQVAAAMAIRVGRFLHFGSEFTNMFHLSGFRLRSPSCTRRVSLASLLVLQVTSLRIFFRVVIVSSCVVKKICLRHLLMWV